jgi:Zn-dependent M28 family amino/carboxypeptidase
MIESRADAARTRMDITVAGPGHADGLRRGHGARLRAPARPTCAWTTRRWCSWLRRERTGAGWNDYAGVDVKGKVVVMFINDPGFHNGDASLFEGRRMTYYGRWTYKFEEAARQGAAAAIIIHDTPGAAYDWSVVKNSWSGAQFDLLPSDDPAPRLPMQGWLTGEDAALVFANAGLTLEKLRAAAGRRGFKAMPIPRASFSAQVHATVKPGSSRNVLARLPGSKRPDEAIVYMAHWDHLGTHTDEPGDNIYNGAIDNATGVAGVLEIAEQFTVQNPKPERSVLFLLVTLEESGLLGSAYYAAHPVVPLKDTVAAMNIDALPVVGMTKDLVVVGLGNSELEDVLKPIADKQGRVLVPEVLAGERAPSSAPTISASPRPACRRCTSRAASTMSRRGARTAWRSWTTTRSTATTRAPTTSTRTGTCAASCRTSTRSTRSASRCRSTRAGRTTARQRLPRDPRQVARRPVRPARRASLRRGEDAAGEEHGGGLARARDARQGELQAALLVLRSQLVLDRSSRLRMRLGLGLADVEDLRRPDHQPIERGSARVEIDAAGDHRAGAVVVEEHRERYATLVEQVALHALSGRSRARRLRHRLAAGLQHRGLDLVGRRPGVHAGADEGGDDVQGGLRRGGFGGRRRGFGGGRGRQHHARNILPLLLGSCP